jgi:hypothetical protein
MMLISVVLPAPFGPSKAKISPRRMSRFTAFRASNPEAYVFLTSFTEIIECTRSPMAISTKPSELGEDAIIEKGAADLRPYLE